MSWYRSGADVHVCWVVLFVLHTWPVMSRLVSPAVQHKLLGLSTHGPEKPCLVYFMNHVPSIARQCNNGQGNSQYTATCHPPTRFSLSFVCPTCLCVLCYLASPCIHYIRTGSWWHTCYLATHRASNCTKLGCGAQFHVGNTSGNTHRTAISWLTYTASRNQQAVSAVGSCTRTETIHMQAVLVTASWRLRS